jgi:hypothetical protein
MNIKSEIQKLPVTFKPENTWVGKKHVPIIIQLVELPKVMEILKQTFDVVILKSSHPSFSWLNGLYARYKEEDGILSLWKIVNGKLQTYEDGSPDITCTGINNTDVHETNMTITE